MVEEDEENPYGDRWDYGYPFGASSEELMDENACPNCQGGNIKLILDGKGLDGEYLSVVMCSDCGFMFDPETKREIDSDELLGIKNEIEMRKLEEEQIMQEMRLAKNQDIETLKKEIEKNSRNKWARYFLSKEMIKKGLNPLKEAQAQLMKVIEIDDKLYAPYFQLGKLFYEMGCLTDAEKKFREALKRNPDSAIINEYLSRCLMRANPSEMQEIQNMQAEDVFRKLEIYLRSFIERKLREKYGNKWEGHVPRDHIAKWEDKKKRDKEINDEELPIFAYADFPHLREIIIKRDNWREVFEPYFKDKEVVASKLKELESIRLIIAHHKRQLQEDEKMRIKLYYCDFQKRMKEYKQNQNPEELIEGEK